MRHDTLAEQSRCTEPGDKVAVSKRMQVAPGGGSATFSHCARRGSSDGARGMTHPASVRGHGIKQRPQWALQTSSLTAAAKSGALPDDFWAIVA